MSKLKKERLDQMIENALTYNQEVKTPKSNIFYKRLIGFILKPNIYGLTFISIIISCILLPQIMKPRYVVDINEINDFITYGIIEDL